MTKMVMYVKQILGLRLEIKSIINDLYRQRILPMCFNMRHLSEFFFEKKYVAADI